MPDPGRTSAWLKSSHILVPDDWLQACVEWIQSEHQGPQQSQDDLNSMVYEQWLLADLHELETRCLPNDVATANKYQLNGAFALQIDGILNVGQSFYSQTQKLKGTENPNAQVTADDPKPWEPKPSRMLLFKMTDGSASVQGMEYKPISCLNPTTPPGTKVLVHGEILCRHGHLMLGEHNLTVLGGEVDTLVEANTQLNTLKSAMDASLQHAGKNHRQQFAGTPLKHSKVQGSNQQSAGSRKNQQWQRSREPSNAGRMSGGPPSRGNKPQMKNDIDKMMEDDPFLDEMDISDLDLLTQPSARNQPNMAATKQSHRNTDSRLTSSSVVTSNKNQNNNTNNRLSAESNTRLGSNAGRQEVQDNNNTFDDEFDAMDEFDDDFDDFDHEMLTHMDGSVVHSNTSKNVAQSNGRNSSNTIQSHDNRSNPSKQSKQQIGHSKKAQLSRGRGDNSSDNTAEKKPFPLFNQGSDKRRVTGMVNSNMGLNSSDNISRNTDSRNNNSATDVSSTAVNHRSLSRRNSSESRKGERSDPDFQKGRTLPDQRPNPVKQEPLGSMPATASVGQGQGSFDQSSDFRMHDSGQGAGKRGVKLEGSEMGHTQSGATNYLTPRKIQRIKEEQHTAVRSQLDIQAEYPFTYLSKLMSRPRPTEPTYHTVKAYISTLTSKLSTENQQWKLSCKINDGTMAVDVDLSSQVLTEMIGFSPQEAHKMRSRIKTDPSVKQVLTEGIQQCQQKLIELMCLLELELSPLSARPVIVATRKVTPHHIDMLHTRVMANWGKFNTPTDT